MTVTVTVRVSVSVRRRLLNAVSIYYYNNNDEIVYFDSQSEYVCVHV